MGSNKYIITKIKCWPVFKQDPTGPLRSFAYLPEWVPLVGVEPALHAHHRHAVQQPQHQPARVPLHRRDRKVLHLFVGQLVPFLQLLSKPS